MAVTSILRQLVPGTTVCTLHQMKQCGVASAVAWKTMRNTVRFIYIAQQRFVVPESFVASALHWADKGIRIRQTTDFPYEEHTRLQITEGKSRFVWMIRYPSWVSKDALKIRINGKNVAFTSQPSSYIAINRQWKKGDVLDIDLPMHSRIEHLLNVPNVCSHTSRPHLLGAKTGTEDLKGLTADDSRWGHIASGERLPIDEAPIIIEEDVPDLVHKLVPVAGKPLTFTMPGQVENYSSICYCNRFIQFMIPGT